MEGALVSEFLMVAVPLIISLPPLIDEKPVGRKLISLDASLMLQICSMVKKIILLYILN